MKVEANTSEHVLKRYPTVSVGESSIYFKAKLQAIYLLS